MKALDVTASVAQELLRSLIQQGALARVNTRYCTPDNATTVHNRKDKLRQYLIEHRPSRSAEMAEYLHIGKRLTAKVLREMIEDGGVYLQRTTGICALACARPNMPVRPKRKSRR